MPHFTHEVGGGVPVYETLITEGSDNGDVRAGRRRPGWSPPDAGRVLAWCLTIAALASTAASVCQVSLFPGAKIASRVVEFTFFVPYSVALIVAAAIALRITSDLSPFAARSSPVTKIAAGALAVSAAGVLVAGLYAIANLLSDGELGADDFSQSAWTDRIGFFGLSVGVVVLAAAALYVLSRDRGSPSANGVAGDDDGTSDSDRGAITLVPRRLFVPVLASVMVATVVLVAETLTAAFPVDRGSFVIAGGFTRSGPSIGTRIRIAASTFNTLPIAFAALTVVVLVASRRRRDLRDGLTEVIGAIAAVVGLLAVGAGAYGVWRAVTFDGRLPGSSEWWARGSGLGVALASGTLGAAAVYVKTRAALQTSVEPEARPTRFDPTVVGLCVAIGALGYAALIVNTIAQSNGGPSTADYIVVLGSYILNAIGLAFAAVIVTAFSRRQARDTWRDAVDVLAGMVALATFAASVFAIVYVIVHNNSNHASTLGEVRDSLLEQAGTAQKLGYVLLALANAVLAAGVLRLIWGSRNPPVDDEPEDEVPLVDLLP